MGKGVGSTTDAVGIVAPFSEPLLGDYEPKTRRMDTFHRNFKRAPSSYFDSSVKVPAVFKWLHKLLTLIEKFDPVSSHHSLATAGLAYAVADKVVPADKRPVFVLSAVLHDIGKISIPINILMKTGEFTPAERAFIKRHPREVFEIVCELIVELIGRVDPQTAIELQEKLDQQDPDIIKLGRILSIVDQFEALISQERAFYRTPLTPQAAANALRRKFVLEEDAIVIDQLLSGDMKLNAGSGPVSPEAR